MRLCFCFLKEQSYRIAAQKAVLFFSESYELNQVQIGKGVKLTLCRIKTIEIKFMRVVLRVT